MPLLALPFDESLNMKQKTTKTESNGKCELSVKVPKSNSMHKKNNEKATIIRISLYNFDVQFNSNVANCRFIGKFAYNPFFVSRKL
jgi:hypothetical protein